MRIALLSTCAVDVPPKGYGGTELVIAELAKMLERRGHDVTVYATGESQPHGALRWRFERRVWPPDDLAELRHAAFAWRDVCTRSPEIDVMHAHQAPAVAFSAVCPVPVVLTLHHERTERLVEYYADFPDVAYVAISRRQAELVPELAIEHVVHHGLDPELYDPAGDGAGGYVAALGRFAPEKGTHLAVDAALAAGVKLVLGGQPHWVNERYFERDVRPRLAAAGDEVQWLGEVALDRKLEMLRGARALLFPIQWEEPFGLVTIEAMLLGTPVIAFARGAAPEVVEPGVTGFLVRDVPEMAERIRQVGAIDRRRCRERARQRWGSMRMAEGYERIYEQAARVRARVSRGERWPRASETSRI